MFCKSPVESNSSGSKITLKIFFYINFSRYLVARFCNTFERNYCLKKQVYYRL